MNHVILCGYLGGDPDVRQTQSGLSVATFSLATNEGKDKEGKDQTEWHKIVAWDKTAELCKKYLAKGRQVLITGKNRTRSYEDKEGVKRYITEVVAQRVEFVGGQKSEQAQTKPAHPAESYQQTGGFNDFSEPSSADIPF